MIETEEMGGVCGGGGGDAMVNGTESPYASCFIPPYWQFHIE